jgi:hypothetical protein
MAAVLQNIEGYSNHPRLFIAGLQNKLSAFLKHPLPSYYQPEVAFMVATVLTYLCNLLQRHSKKTEVLGIFVTSGISVAIQVIFYMDFRRYRNE